MSGVQDKQMVKLLAELENILPAELKTCQGLDMIKRHPRHIAYKNSTASFWIMTNVGTGKVLEDMRAFREALPFLHAAMTALQKKDGGVRGMASGTSFRRLVAKTLARQFSVAVETTCAPFQLALSTRAGVDGRTTLPTGV